ncbi:hypothetical protein [Luxibacter massiliensis]|uniref:hypothetical protein n=1 Tax=Luxibacter massiliensis TaxID=2219695 RepID=UPI000F0480E6|nr:hypothetical protein [Luxibacter massiliensis]
MLDKNRVRLMTKMAAYEKSLAVEDFKISSYYKKDYASMNTLITAIWVTIGYALIVGLVGVCNLDALLKDLTVTKLFIMGGAVVGAYLVILIIYCVCAGSFYKTRHNKAKQRMKKYYRDLSRLGKLYMKEKN